MEPQSSTRSNSQWIEGWVTLQHLRTNLFIASWTLILLAAGISVGVPGSGGLAVAAPLGIVGSIMLVWAISMKEEPQGLTEEEISNWAPEADPLPPGAGGSVMYRVDTTLDEPIEPVFCVVPVAMSSGLKEKTSSIHLLAVIYNSGKKSERCFSRNGQEEDARRPPTEACTWNCPTMRSGC